MKFNTEPGRTGAMRLIQFSHTMHLTLFGVFVTCVAWGSQTLVLDRLTFVTLPIVLMIPILAAAIVVDGAAKSLRPFDLLPVGMLLIAAASYTWSPVPDHTRRVVMILFLCLVTYYSARLLMCRDHRSFFMVICFSIFAGTTLAGAMLAPPPYGERYTIVGVNQNYVAYVIAGMAYLMAAFTLFHRFSAIYVILSSIYFAFAFILLYLINTRGALLSVAAMAIWLLIIATIPRLRTIGKALPVVALAAAILISAGALNPILLLVDVLLGHATGDLSGRFPVWEIAREAIASAPVLGVGAGAFPLSNPSQIGAHNVLLTMWLDLGVVGLVCFALLLVYGLRPGFSGSDAGWPSAVLGLFACFYFPIAVTGHTELSPFIWGVFGVTFSLVRSAIGQSYRP
jgi:O-antigen ligase